VSHSAEPPLPSASAYRRAGVDLDEARRSVSAIRRLVRSTYTARVESEIGSFAGFFSFPDPDGERLLVASMDGVGTKLKIAAILGRWSGVGYDIVSHCVNDILVHGARPIFFLDYIGAGRLSAAVVEELVGGMSEACRLAGCALLGGETAEMPGMYPPGELDLVGTIIGEVRRDALVDGRGIRPGDRILGLAADGLHTNGYSLARSIFRIDADPAVLARPLASFAGAVDGRGSGDGGGTDQDGTSPAEKTGGTTETLGDALLRRHRMYLPLLRPLIEGGRIRGMAHITGGGLLENLPRILPPGCRAAVRRDSWSVPAIFRCLVAEGGLGAEEALRFFNMGIGYTLVTAPEDVGDVEAHLASQGEIPVRLGWVEEGNAEVRLAGANEDRPGAYR
jgi:phosphoribosylformylglycinamidine cyclo-ligase